MKKIIYTILALFPGVVLAAKFDSVTSLINFISDTINSSVAYLIMSLAVVFFLWGVAKFIKNSDDEGEREKGRSYMIWGLIGLFVMVSMWGIIAILAGTFGIKPVIPGLPTSVNSGTTGTTSSGPVSCGQPGSDPATCIPTGFGN